jgi:hypothetical protein
LFLWSVATAAFQTHLVAAPLCRRFGRNKACTQLAVLALLGNFPLPHFFDTSMLGSQELTRDEKESKGMISFQCHRGLGVGLILI